MHNQHLAERIKLEESCTNLRNLVNHLKTEKSAQIMPLDLGSSFFSLSSSPFSLDLVLTLFFWFGRWKGRNWPSRMAKIGFNPCIIHLVIMDSTWTNEKLPKLPLLVLLLFGQLCTNLDQSKYSLLGHWGPAKTWSIDQVLVNFSFNKSNARILGN